MAAIWRHVARGARLFVVQPGYALAAVVTLALAIGANSVIFSMANVLVLKPLPFADPERLAWIFASSPDSTSWRGPISLPEYAAYRDRVPAIASLSAWQRRTFTMSDGRHAERVLAHVVIGDLHALWDLSSALGRRLTRSDEAPGAQPVIVLSHRFWSTRFGNAADILGQRLRIDGGTRTVVGVLSPDIELGSFSEVDVWLPYQSDPALAAHTDRSWRGLGRLAAGATLDLAHAQVSDLSRSLAAAHPDTDAGRSARVGPTRDALGAPNMWVILSLLVTVVGLLLVLACANVMNLLIARLIARGPELAVRTALGATRGRIVSDIVAESLLLGLAGGALGLAVAWAGLQAIRAVAYEPFFRQLTLDARVVGFGVVLAFVAPLVFSVIPALRMLRGDVHAALGEALVRSVASRATARGQSALVVLQVTLAVTLLVLSSLVVQSMRAITRIDVGYGVDGLVSTEVEIPAWMVGDEGDANRLRASLVERAGAIPGVDGVTLATELPVLDGAPTVTFAIGAARAADAPDRPSAGLTTVGPDFFPVMRVPIIAGRAFERADASSPSPVAIVSLEAARRYFGDAARATGTQITIDAGAGRTIGPATVIGVAVDLANPDIEQTLRPQLYVLDAHHPTRTFHLIARGEHPGHLAGSLRAAVEAVSADIPTYRLRTVVDAFADEHSSSTVLSGMFAAFALVAVLLATAGIYGVMSYAVSQRTREIAVRMALGATRRDVATSVVARSLRLAATGSAFGIVAAFGLAQSMRSILYGIDAGDPATYASVLALTAAAAVAAAWIPVRRAAGVDPVKVLRQA